MLEFRDERARKVYEKLSASAGDISFARYCASVLIKNGWHSAPWERRGTVYSQQAAFTTALVVAYCRPFTNSKGWPSLPARLIDYTKSEQTLHKALLKLRHTVYAHSDSSSYQFRPFRLADGIITDMETRPMLRLSKDDTELFTLLAAKVLNAIYHEISLMRRQLNQKA